MLIGIAAHTSRLPMATALAKVVEADVLNVDDTEATSYEEAMIACADNHFAVLTQLYERSEGHRWIVCLEDDALPVDDFRLHAEAALQHAPSLAGFYIGVAGANLNRDVLERAVRTNTAWATSPHMISALAYAIRVEALSQVLSRYPLFPPETSVERRITDWARDTRGGDWYGEPLFHYTLPSLVDHGGDDSIIFPDPDVEARRAWSVGIAPDWNTPSVLYDP